MGPTWSGSFERLSKNPHRSAYQFRAGPCSVGYCHESDRRRSSTVTWSRKNLNEITAHLSRHMGEYRMAVFQLIPRTSRRQGFCYLPVMLILLLWPQLSTVCIGVLFFLVLDSTQLRGGEQDEHSGRQTRIQWNSLKQEDHKARIWAFNTGTLEKASKSPQGDPNHGLRHLIDNFEACSKDLSLVARLEGFSCARHGKRVAGSFPGKATA